MVMMKFYEIRFRIIAMLRKFSLSLIEFPNVAERLSLVSFTLQDIMFIGDSKFICVYVVWGSLGCINKRIR